MNDSASTAYVLEPSALEIDRLLMASRLLDPIAAAACLRAGLGAGGAAIDVGCGPLGALAALSRIVGPSGRVVGVDVDGRALSTAQAALSRLGIGGVQLVEADANSLTAASVGTGFDLAFCRLVLMHQTDPAATMRRIASLVRPGGAVIAYDFFAPSTTEPPIPAVGRAWELVIAAMGAKGASPDASRRYREHAEAAGLEVMSERGTFLPMPLAALLADIAGLLSGARRVIEQAGIAPAAEVDELLARLRLDLVGRVERSYSALTIELIARRP